MQVEPQPLIAAATYGWLVAESPKILPHRLPTAFAADCAAGETFVLCFGNIYAA